MVTMNSHEASPSKSRWTWTYEVYLSFMGADTHRITDHLWRDLERAGFHMYRDDVSLVNGEDIATELLKDIEGSRVSVILLSKNYASSRWCLKELVMSLKCRSLGHVVLPVFCGVDPSEVRGQTGSFEADFVWHEKIFIEEMVQEWRAALKEVADLAGYNLPNSENENGQRVIFSIIGYINTSNRPQSGRPDWLDLIASRPEEERTRGKRNKEEISNSGVSIGDWCLEEICVTGKLLLRNLELRVQSYHFDPSKSDSLKWEWSGNKNFTVKSVYEQWEMQTQFRNPILSSLWKNICPPKVEVLTWKAVQEKLATRSVLLSRNIALTDSLCPFCSLQQETPNHLFLHCQFSWYIWTQILDWWHTKWVCPLSIVDLLCWWFDNSFRNLEKHIWEACFYATIWSIWLTRNGYIFKDAAARSDEVVDIIKFRVAIWIKVKFNMSLYSVEDFKRFLDGICLLKL